jgi:ABC-type lipoprotein export system ATPase subunit
VGRQAELDVLDEALREATSGTGSVVFLVGEPGLGKTRLITQRGVVAASTPGGQVGFRRTLPCAPGNLLGSASG